MNMDMIMGIAAMFAAALIIEYIKISTKNKNKKKKTYRKSNAVKEAEKILKEKQSNTTEKEVLPEILPYRRKKYIFTRNEYSCYKNLKTAAEEIGLSVMCKMRLADLVDVTAKDNSYIKWFNKVKAKHIDFVLCNKDTMEPKIMIELDDSSHNKENRQQRDMFVDKVCKDSGYKIIHIKGYNQDFLRQTLKENMYEQS